MEPKDARAGVRGPKCFYRSAKSARTKAQGPSILVFRPVQSAGESSLTGNHAKCHKCTPRQPAPGHRTLVFARSGVRGPPPLWVKTARRQRTRTAVGRPPRRATLGQGVVSRARRLRFFLPVPVVYT